MWYLIGKGTRGGRGPLCDFSFAKAPGEVGDPLCDFSFAKAPGEVGDPCVTSHLQRHQGR